MTRSTPAGLTVLLALSLTAPVLTAPARAAPDPSQLDVLFIGNSYVNQNDLPKLTKALLTELHDGEVRVEALLRTGGKLKQAERDTSKDSPWRDMLVKEKWDWVILQEQSQVPGFGANQDDWDNSLRAIKKLDARIAGTGGNTALLNTWGYLNGDPRNRAIYPDYPTMQSRLDEGYGVFEVALTSGVREPRLIPAGPAFERIYLDLVGDGRDPLDPAGPFHALYYEDGGHPSPAGSYLAACVIAASLTGESPAGTGLGPDMGPVMSSYLQDVAARIVLGTPPQQEAPLTPDPAPPPLSADVAAGNLEPPATGGCGGWFGAVLLFLPLAGLRRSAGISRSG